MTVSKKMYDELVALNKKLAAENRGWQETWEFIDAAAKSPVNGKTNAEAAQWMRLRWLGCKPPNKAKGWPRLAAYCDRLEHELKVLKKLVKKED
jgi:hypothetical protein